MFSQVYIADINFVLSAPDEIYWFRNEAIDWPLLIITRRRKTRKLQTNGNREISYAWYAFSSSIDVFVCIFFFCFLIFGRLIRRANHKECNANVHPSSWSQSHFCRRPSVIFHAGVNEFPRAIAQFSANIPMLRVIMAKRRKWKVTYWLVHKLKLSMNEWTQIKAALRVIRYARNNRKLRKKFVFLKILQTFRFIRNNMYKVQKKVRSQIQGFQKKLTYFTFYRERSIWI